jgi:hypothetical protein
MNKIQTAGIWVALVIVALISIVALSSSTHLQGTKLAGVSGTQTQFTNLITGCGSPGCYQWSGTTTGSIYANGPVFSGGLDATTSTAASVTLLPSDLTGSNGNGISTIAIQPFVNNLVALKLPASSTLSTFLQNQGDSVQIDIQNVSTTTPITLSGNTGFPLYLAGATLASSAPYLAAGRGATLDIQRSATSTDFIGVLSPSF